MSPLKRIVKARLALMLAFGLALPACAHAHVGAHEEKAVLGGADPLGIALLLVAAIVYARGATALAARGADRGQLRRRAALFGAGWSALALSFAPPLEPLTAISFAAHMLQHEVIMLVAAPLLALSHPVGALLRGLPGGLRRAATGAAGLAPVRASFVALAAPLGAWLLHLVALWGWHVPGAFDAAVRNEAVHWAQHLTFFLAAQFFWHSVFAAGRHAGGRGPALLSVFTTAVHGGVLAALLTFSSTVWYPAYRASAAFGLTPLEDQQLGGLIMWVPGGFVFLAAGLAIAALWLKESGAAAALAKDRP